MSALVVGLSLGSAFGSAVSTTLKKSAASRAPSLSGGVRGVGRFARATAGSPWWLAAILADAVGVGLQVVALHLGALALVQPLLVSGLLFALLLRHVGRWRMSWAEALWAVTVAGCLVGFLLLSGAVSGAQPAAADRGAAVLAALAAALAVAICLLAARGSVPPARRAALLGVAVGAIYATTAALIKSVTGVFAAHGPGALVTSWQLYTLLVVGVGGLVLAQIAFQAGPLTASLPAMSTVDPLLSVLIGVVIYDERLRPGPGHGVVLLALVGLLVVAVLGLARVETTDPSTDTAAQGCCTSR